MISTAKRKGFLLCMCCPPISSKSISLFLKRQPFTVMKLAHAPWGKLEEKYKE